MTVWQFAAEHHVTATILAAIAFSAFVTGLVYAERIVRAIRGG